MSMDSLAPTRMNLLQLKAQVKLAKDGVGLLKGKRDALLQELLGRARELRAMRDDLYQRGREAVATLAMARAVRGTAELRSAGMAGHRELNVRVQTEKVWGLTLGNVELHNIVRTPEERSLGLFDCSSHVLEAGETAEQMLEQLLKCAPLERNLLLIGEEVKKVSRRINALEEYLIPKLLDDIGGIASVLDEREREDIFRLKRIKGKKAADKRKKADSSTGRVRMGARPEGEKA
ncbi:MAG: V-type ATP synthase subunit D [FCB group bacterium]|jgi:V/A-type H+-transporting ATPase subunit D|nr:V-type ATP synthase subunit D [FCB group bacterium]